MDSMFWVGFRLFSNWMKCFCLLRVVLMFLIIVLVEMCFLKMSLLVLMFGIWILFVKNKFYEWENSSYVLEGIYF